MTCLKCGRETDRTFCESCRQTMEKYPVKPGAIVLLPKERSLPPVRRNMVRRPAVSLETQLQTQKIIIRRLTVVTFSLLVLLVAMGYASFRYISLNGARPVGQNYSTVTKSAGESLTAEQESVLEENES